MPHVGKNRQDEIHRGKQSYSEKGSRHDHGFYVSNFNAAFQDGSNCAENNRADAGTVEWVPLAIGALSGVAAQVDAVSVRFLRLNAKATGGSRAQSKAAAETLAQLTASVRERIADMRTFYEDIVLDECGVLFERERLKLQRLLTSAQHSRPPPQTGDTRASPATSSAGDRSPRNGPTGATHLRPSPLRIPTSREARPSMSAPATPAGRRRVPQGAAAAYVAASQPPLLTQPPAGCYRPPLRSNREGGGDVVAPLLEQALLSFPGMENGNLEGQGSAKPSHGFPGCDQWYPPYGEGPLREMAHGHVRGARQATKSGEGGKTGVSAESAPLRGKRPSKIVELVVRLSPFEYAELMAQRRARGLS